MSVKYTWAYAQGILFRLESRLRRKILALHPLAVASGIRSLEIKRGFTLIELIIVMAIFAIIAAIGIGAYTSSQQKGWDAQRVQNLAGVRQAVEIYYNDYGKYPPASSGNINSCSGGTCSWGGGSFNDVNGTIYMRQLPKDPRDPQRTYYYTVAGDQSWFKIYACIENAQDPRRVVGGYAGTNCGGCIESNATLCNYGISSPNTIP